jgi:hypothetical protein
MLFAERRYFCMSVMHWHLAYVTHLPNDVQVFRTICCGVPAFRNLQGPRHVDIFGNDQMDTAEQLQTIKSIQHKII